MGSEIGSLWGFGILLWVRTSDLGLKSLGFMVLVLLGVFVQDPKSWGFQGPLGSRTLCLCVTTITIFITNIFLTIITITSVIIATIRVHQAELRSVAARAVCFSQCRPEDYTLNSVTDHAGLYHPITWVAVKAGKLSSHDGYIYIYIYLYLYLCLVLYVVPPSLIIVS